MRKQLDLKINFNEKLNSFFAQRSLPKTLAVAVSGGVDSLALTFLLSQFCQKNKIKLIALTVDHKMRKSSTLEAQNLNKILKKFKILHQILTITWDKKPTSNIESKMREARYKLLTEHCKQNKIHFLFFGHQANDVAENFLIRLFRGSQLDGLSSISEVSQVNEINIIRPLLDISKNHLQKFLQQQNITWFEDESNNDEKFLRNKIRKFFSSFDDAELIQKRIKSASDEIAKMRDFIDSVVLTKAKDSLVFDSSGFFLINKNSFKKIDEKIALKILALVLIEIGGKVYKPRLEKLKNFYNYITQNDSIKPRTFYHCLVKKFDANNLIILAEKPNNIKQLKLRTILKTIF